jgi:RNA polymerase sigma factor (sigma-70 family)
MVSNVPPVERYLRPLLNYARDEIRAQEALGRLEPGQLSPEEVVDAAVAEALATPQDPPTVPVYPRLRRLVRRVVEREARQHRPERHLFESVGNGRPDDNPPRTPRRLIDILPDPRSPVPDQVVDSLEFQHALATILRQLPTAWREPFVLHVRDGLTVRDIARLEGLSVAEVRQRIQWAREFLRARLAEEYDDSALPPPTETIFDLLDHIDPTPDQLARVRGDVQAA